MWRILFVCGRMSVFGKSCFDIAAAWVNIVALSIFSGFCLMKATVCSSPASQSADVKRMFNVCSVLILFQIWSK